VLPATLYFTPDFWYKLQMSRGLFRLLLIVALALAIPMKAIAGVTMLGCVSHPGPGVASSPEHHAHAEPATGHDHGQMHHELPDSATSHDGHRASPPSHADAKVKCGTCAPCCAGAALIGSFSAAVSDFPVHADFPASAPLHPSGRHTRLDRPPRQLVA
jgi:hypothetical protein